MTQKTAIKNIIFPIEFDHFTGGMIHSVMTLARSLKNDYNVYIIAYKEAEVFKIDSDINPLELQKPWSISISTPFSTFGTHLEVRKLVKHFKKSETIVFTNNVGSELIFSGFGFFPIDLKRVFVSRGGDYLGKTGWIVRQGFKSVSKFIAISKRQKNVLINVGIDEKKIAVIHNGIKANLQLEKRKSSSLWRLAIVGYINENKNQLLGIESLKLVLNKHENVKIYIYGEAFTESDKHYRKKVEDRIDQLGIKNQVEFMGFEKNQAFIFNNTDILISTSLSEGFGRTVAEAMGYSIPCIGLIESGGLLDIISHGHDGFLVNNSKEQLSSAVIKLINNDDLRDDMASNARETYVKKFTEEIMCGKYLKFIKEEL